MSRINPNGMLCWNLEMLEYVGHPVAMTNSDPEIWNRGFALSVADNNDDGVLKTILEKI